VPNYTTSVFPSDGFPPEKAEWLKQYAGKPLPFIDEIQLDVQPENIPRFVLFRQGYLDVMGVSLDEFEDHIVDGLIQERMMEQVCSPQAVEQYFKLNSPRFDSVEISHIVLDSEGKAREMMSALADDPESFAEMVSEYSVGEARENGGVIGKVLRGSLKPDIEARVFNAAAGDLLGPFPSPDRTLFEIYMVNARYPATLDEETAVEVRRLLREEWLAARAQEHIIEACPAR